MSPEEAEAECRRWFNRVGLFGGTVPCRIVGFCDGAEDYYYIAHEWPRLNGPRKSYQSMVGGFDPVDGEYTNRAWDGMVPPVPKFIVEVETKGDR